MHIFRMGARFAWGCDCPGCPMGGSNDTENGALAALNDHRSDHRYPELTLEEATHG